MLRIANSQCRKLSISSMKLFLIGYLVFFPNVIKDIVWTKESTLGSKLPRLGLWWWLSYTTLLTPGPSNLDPEAVVNLCAGFDWAAKTLFRRVDTNRTSKKIDAISGRRVLCNKDIMIPKLTHQELTLDGTKTWRLLWFPGVVLELCHQAFRSMFKQYIKSRSWWL